MEKHTASKPNTVAAAAPHAAWEIPRQHAIAAVLMQVPKTLNLLPNGRCPGQTEDCQATGIAPQTTDN